MDTNPPRNPTSPSFDEGPECGFTPPYSIEIFECGTWYEVEVAPDLRTAMTWASGWADQFGERRVIVTDFKLQFLFE